MAPAEEVKFEGPEPRKHSVTGIDGQEMIRAWCDTCGSSVYLYCCLSNQADETVGCILCRNPEKPQDHHSSKQVNSDLERKAVSSHQLINFRIVQSWRCTEPYYGDFYQGYGELGKDCAWG